jgi:putative lipoprotein
METSMQMAMFIRAFAAILVLLASPAWAETTTINGSVTYRERLALPPDATLRVTLVRLDGAVPVAGAGASIPTRGVVPIAFALSIDTERDILDGTYGILAEISAGGRVLFRNPVAVPVMGEPVHILVNHAPEPARPPEPGLPQVDFLEMEWTVTSVGGRPVTGTRPLTLTIAADLRAGGSGGCNDFFTEVSIEGETIAFGPPAATRMACEPTIMDQEFAYFAALSAVAAFEHDDQGLRLLDAAGIPLVGLVRETE